MWLLFRMSFRDHLVSVLGFGKDEAKHVTAAAGTAYRRIIAGLPEFEKTDRFKMNIVNCVMFSAFLLSLREMPSVEKLTDCYAASMMTAPCGSSAG